MSNSRIRIGSAPDSWGVWFPSDPVQVPADRFLAEVSASGYEWIELGPYGYLPTDPAQLQDQLDAHHLKVSAGTVFSRLHHENSWDEVWKQVTDVAALTQAVGGQHIVVIPFMWRDDKTGLAIESREFSEEQWTRITTGHDELGRRILDEYGLHVQFHSHADSHVGYQKDIERFVESTNPDYVNLCLDTGHVAYYGGDSVGLIQKYPERIGYLHLKAVDPVLRAEVLANDISFSEAVKRGIMIEPPAGEPNLDEVLTAARALDRDLYGIVEQDLYPCPVDMPFPIARRTHTFLSSCGDPSWLEIGTQHPLSTDTAETTENSKGTIDV
ncbi:TIM barrel protein [Nakamurella flavida]|uniref:TIM barrel protein n=1 Tax=Nakamurella flavida TaxID=363630 RepID=A0A938YMJ5_9ACTN|nr:sugar phosphate isomerase/epimerase [Nakamurella flavida]MBM9477296.1 TIM barrel protein [Nakamurella flavida]MDP9779752.1 inosose dehydratase [Nakamurella flavida]